VTLSICDGRSILLDLAIPGPKHPREERHDPGLRSDVVERTFEVPLHRHSNPKTEFSTPQFRDGDK
jgi:hypothetical protein